MSEKLSSDLASLRIDRRAPPARRTLGRIVALALIAAVAASAVAIVPRVQGALFMTEVTATEVQLISPAQAATTLTATGYVTPRSSSKVGASASGRVARVHVKQGDLVKAGDVLIELDDAEQRAEISAAAARVAVARARAASGRAGLAELEQQISREQALVDRNVSGRATLEDMRARLRTLDTSARAAEVEVQATAAELESLRVRRADRRIVAPISGTVLTRVPVAGEIVNALEPVLELVDLSSLVVEADIPEARLALIQPRQPCEIVLDAAPSRRHRCTVVEIGKRVNRAKATVPATVGFSDSVEGMLPEMGARVSFLTEAVALEALKEPPKRVVPAGAIAARGGAKVVFVIDHGRVRMVPIRVGEPISGGFELLDGPPPGTRVVESPAVDLMDEQKVKEKGS